MLIKKFVFALLLMLNFGSSKIISQAVNLTDYERAVSFARDNLINKSVFNLQTTVNWLEENRGIWFVDFSAEGPHYKWLFFDTNIVESIFDNSKLSSALTEITGNNVNPLNLKVSKISKENDGRIKFSTNGKNYILNPRTYILEEVKEVEEEEEVRNNLESPSPDGKWIAFTKAYNLFVRNTDGSDTIQLSFDGYKNYEYGSYYGWFDKMVGENGDRPERFSVSWSENSRYLSTNLCDLRVANKMYMLDYSVDSLFRPRLLSYYRGSPGDTNMVYITPKIYDLNKRKEVITQLPRNTHINSVQLRWSENQDIALVSYSERGFKNLFVKTLDLKSGILKTIIHEKSSTNVDDFRFRELGDKGKIIFLSQRSGWRQLYEADIATGETKAITHGNYVINNIQYIDEENSSIYVSASAADPDMNPYHQQIYKIDLSGKVDLLTPEKAHHIVSFSEDGKYFSDNYSTVNIPTISVLRNASDGSIISNLTNADVTMVEEKGWKAPHVFSLIGKDGESKIYGALWKPTNFDPKKSYPIVDHSYTGPHTQVFPRTFSQGFNNQAFAELGFIVMMVDGLGTYGRSKKFANFSYQDMGNNLEDHVRAIKSLAAKYSWINGEKVGIYGHSAGGYDAGHGMLAFPDTYKVGVASSADHDFRMEKAWWPEMYMGWPVDSLYHDVSNITMAGQLKGKLLIVHGGLDDNVNTSASFKLAEALIKNDKEFDLLIIPSQRHGYSGNYRKYFIKKRWNYFVRHLKDTEPIWDFEWK